MNCGTAIVITTSFLDQCKKRQRKEKFRGFLYLFIWLDIKSKQMNRSAYWVSIGSICARIRV
ncbi:hypothetical protein, partial [Enterococcus faecium]|uniref:hypothetical protein n=1 Tax=Enterococcus faecium TaxID=1352 RepID=UPI00376FE8C1